MRYWEVSNPRDDFFQEDVKKIFSDDDIIKMYFEYWCGRMKEVDKGLEISEQNCIEDWVVTNWAVEKKMFKVFNAKVTKVIEPFSLLCEFDLGFGISIKRTIYIETDMDIFSEDIHTKQKIAKFHSYLNYKVLNKEVILVFNLENSNESFIEDSYNIATVYEVERDYKNNISLNKKFQNNTFDEGKHVV